MNERMLRKVYLILLQLFAEQNSSQQLLSDRSCEKFASCQKIEKRSTIAADGSGLDYGCGSHIESQDVQSFPFKKGSV